MDLVNGKLRFSETSLDVATLYTINTGTKVAGTQRKYVKDFPLKSKMHAAVIRTSSQKVGQTNVNSLKDFYDLKKPVLTYRTSTKNFGIQLDPAHHADESILTEPTQVVSALASAGYLSDVAGEVYEDLAELMKSSMKKTLNLLNANKIKTEQNVIIDNTSQEQVDTINELEKVTNDNEVYLYLAKWIKKRI